MYLNNKKKLQDYTDADCYESIVLAVVESLGEFVPEAMCSMTDCWYFGVRLSYRVCLFRVMPHCA